MSSRRFATTSFAKPRVECNVYNAFATAYFTWPMGQCRLALLRLVLFALSVSPFFPFRCAVFFLAPTYFYIETDSALPVVNFQTVIIYIQEAALSAPSVRGTSFNRHKRQAMCEIGHPPGGCPSFPKTKKKEITRVE